MGRAGDGRHRWAPATMLAFFAVVAVLAGACGSRQNVGSATPTEQTAGSTVEPKSGVLDSWTAKISRDEEPPSPPDGDLSITKCLWHGPGRWSAELVWQADPAPTPEQPVELPLLVGFGVNPARLNPETSEQVGGFYGFNSGIADIIGNGSFTIPLSGALFGPVQVVDGWWALHQRALLSPSGRCGILVLGPDATDPDFEAGVEVALDPRPLDIDAGSPGGTDSSGDTIESLALQVPVTPEWREHPMAALALLAATDGVPVDQLFFDPTYPVGSIDVKHIAPCVVVMIIQAAGTVRQTRDCESVPLPAAGQDFDLTQATSIENLDTGMWAVEAVGPDEFIDSILGFAFSGGVDPSVAERLDLEVAVALGLVEGEPNASEQAQASDGWFVLGSYELIGGAGGWRGEQVEVSFDSTNDDCCLAYEVEVDGFNGGAAVTACRDWAISLHDDGKRGFVVAIVTGDQTVQFIVDAEPMGVPLQRTAMEESPIRAGAIDAPFDFSAEVDWFSRVQVLEPDGSRSECVQN